MSKDFRKGLHIQRQILKKGRHSKISEKEGRKMVEKGNFVK